MPLTSKGEKILSHLKSEYGSDEKAKQVLYAGKNKGTFTGIDGDKPWPHSHEYPEWLKKELEKSTTNSGKMNREMKTKAWQKRNLPDSATMTRIADAVDGLARRFDASQYESKEEEDKARAERRKKALEEAEKPRDIKPGVAKSSGSKRPFMVDSATMTRIADAVDGLARRFDAMVDAYGK